MGKVGQRWRDAISRLREGLRAAPLLKILAAMAAGVVCGTLAAGVVCGTLVAGIPLWGWIVAGVVCGVSAWFCRRLGWLVTLYTLLCVVFFGAAIARAHTPRAVVPRGERVWLDVRIAENPTLRGTSTRTVGYISNWRHERGQWQRAGERLLVGADTMWRLEAGARVVFRGLVGPVSDSVTSYSRLMTARGITGRTFVSRWSRASVTPPGTHSPRVWARRVQSAATERLMRLAKTDGGVDPKSEGAVDPSIAVAAAMTVGDRRGITPTLRRAYSRTGASHLLAVSGLHVGIVFGLINALLYLLPLARRGHIVKNIVAVMATWLYAFLSGFSPSAARAAFMFTGAQAALASPGGRSTANIMCGVALVMLALTPGLLFDVSFQLSFVAVGAIVAWFRPIYRLVESRWKGLNVLWAMLVAGAIASVATMPLVSHTFGVFSPVGAVLAPPLVVAAQLVILFSMVWIVAPIAALEPVFRWLVGGVAGFQNRVVELAAAVPGVAVEWRMPVWGLFAAYGAMILSTLWLNSRPRPREPFEL